MNIQKNDNSLTYVDMGIATAIAPGITNSSFLNDGNGVVGANVASVQSAMEDFPNALASGLFTTFLISGSCSLSRNRMTQQFSSMTCRKWYNIQRTRQRKLSTELLALSRHESITIKSRLLLDRRIPGLFCMDSVCCFFLLRSSISTSPS